MDNLRAMIWMRRRGRTKKERIKEMVGVCKVDEVIDESAMGWCGHMKIVVENIMVKSV